MAEKITMFEDQRLNQQFGEILRNLTHKNVRTEDEFFILTSPNGTKYKLQVDDAGNLSTAQI